ncbi:sodium/phosphate symporter [Grosmannia clavigera kw1407]|uniref:Sodium/phosphate symporter n=1 Tax=Grosmannia clavigera (strain kw1407 / UAMH 11150) TaxID=655863 RepID=F0XB85_GROCL|nr:sodium/phosphate symporter [Grosmannia clavigera kw1407]EFX05077.1 sodium/phosphate symporter [Grosmannia clavigera kw1407]
MLDQYTYVFVIGTLFALLDAYNNGANDVANAWATSVSSRSISYRQAMVFGTVFEMLGAICVGARTADTIKNGIIPTSAFRGDAGVQMLAFTCALAAASSWVMWCTRHSAHVSSTYSLISAVAGVGVATVGAANVQWGWNKGKGMGAIFAGLVMAPIIAAGFGAILFLLIKLTVHVRRRPVPWAVWTSPFFFLIAGTICTLSIVYKGSPSLGLSKKPAWYIAAVTMGTGGGVCLLSAVFFVPFVHACVIKKDVTVHWWMFVYGPLLFRRPAPEAAERAIVPNYAVVQDDDEDEIARQQWQTASAGSLSDKDARATKQVDEPTTEALAEVGQTTYKELVAANNERFHAKLRKTGGPLGWAMCTLHDNPMGAGQIYEVRNIKMLFRRLPAYVVAGALYGLHYDIHAAQTGIAGTPDGERMARVYAHAEKYANEVEHTYSFVQVLTACTASFAHGANDIGNSVGPWAVIYSAWKTGDAAASKAPVPVWQLAVLSLAISLGLITYGYNIMKVMGNKITYHSPSRGCSMEMGAAITVLVFSQYSLPVSTSMCITGATVGVGLCNGTLKAVNFHRIGLLLLAWIMTIPISGTLARLVLLTLIDMYCSDGVVPDADDDFILQLIGSYMADSYGQPSSRRQRQVARWQRAYLNVDLLSRLHSLREPLQGCFVASSAADLPMCATLWDTLVARLWLRLTCLDDLVPFFDGLSQHVAPTYSELRARRELGLEDPPDRLLLLDRRSPMGQLVYQACIEFTRLSFSGRCDLWEDFVRYRNPSRADFNILWPHDFPTDRLRMDAVLTEYQDQWGDRVEQIEQITFDRMLKDRSVPASSDETEKLVSLLIDRERRGFRPSYELRSATDKAIEGSTLIPAQTTYYRLTEAWRIGDSNTAYDQLHRYFDLVARQGVGAAFGYNMGPMNKAIMQRDFGEHPDDLLSMLDAVHAGRESRDYNSLRFSLLWLYLYARMMPRHIRPHQLQGLAGQPTDGDQVLPYVRHDARMAQAHVHRALAFALEARVALADGRPPLYVRVCLRDGSRLTVGHNETTLLGQLVSTAMLFWENAGAAGLAVSHGRAFLRTREDAVPFDDALRVASRVALHYCHGGSFADARAVLRRLSSEGLSSLRPQSRLRHVLTVVAATEAIRSGRFDKADDLLRRLPAGGYPTTAKAKTSRASQGPSELDPDLAAHVALLQIQSLARRGEGALVLARDALETLETAYDGGVGDLHVLIRMGLARCDLYARAGRAVRGLSVVIRSVQACLCRRYHQLLWEAVGALARLLVAEGEFAAARTLLAVAIPRTLQDRDGDRTAELYSYLGDAHMGMAGELWRAVSTTTAAAEKDRQKAKMKRHLSKAWRCLKRAEEQFRLAGSGEVVEGEFTMKRKTILAVTRRLNS